MPYKLSEQEAIARIKKIAATKSHEFVGWFPASGGYLGISESRLVMKCPSHGVWKGTSLRHYLRVGRCPTCSVEKRNRNAREPEEQAVKALKKLAKKKGDRFLGFAGEYRGRTSKLRLECPRHGIWETTEYRNYLKGARCARCWIERAIEGRTHKEPDVRKKLTALAERNGFVFENFVEGRYASANKTKAVFYCPEHDYRWQKTVTQCRNGVVCRRCERGIR